MPFVDLVLRRGDDVEETPDSELGVLEGKVEGAGRLLGVSVGNVVGVVTVGVSEKRTLLVREVGVSEGVEFGIVGSSKLAVDSSKLAGVVVKD